jgi:DNA polymerase III epsilon subunit-like protein
MEQKLVFFDLETGGLNPKRHPIIQLAAIAVDDNLNILEAFEAKFRFDTRRANKYSLRKNHYHSGTWAHEARDGEEIGRDFAEFLKRHASFPAMSAQGKPYHVAQLVAHNAAFDGPFLMSWFERLGVFLPAKRLVLCTMQLAMWHFVSSNESPPPNYQLATLCERFRVPFHASAAHEALGDTTATVRLYQSLARSTRAKERRAV